jgi:hypothetical protein
MERNVMEVRRRDGKELVEDGSMDGSTEMNIYYNMEGEEEEEEEEKAVFASF